jgi:hypothetical protein
VSVTDDPKDPIPHGLEGYRKYGCTCDDGTVKSCLGANRAYHRERRAARAERRDETDELAALRLKRKGKPASKQTETSDSVPKRRRTPGEMEIAVIEECSTIENVKPTLVVAAENLGRCVDDLTGNPKTIALYNSTLKQLMSTMAELRGNETDKRKTGKRKSGGRLATVGALTKVKRTR